MKDFTTLFKIFFEKKISNPGIWNIFAYILEFQQNALAFMNTETH